MSGGNDGNIIAFSSKITVKQSGDQSGMSPGKPRIIVMVPLGLYTVGMHHQDTSRHPWVRDFTNSWDTCSQRAVVAPEAFRPAVVQEAHRNVAYSGRCNLPFGWAKLYDGAGRSARLGQGLIHQLQRG